MLKVNLCYNFKSNFVSVSALKSSLDIWIYILSFCVRSNLCYSSKSNFICIANISVKLLDIKVMKLFFQVSVYFPCIALKSSLKNDSIYENLSRFKVNSGTPSMHLCMVPLEAALHLEVFGQVMVSLLVF